MRIVVLIFLFALASKKGLIAFFCLNKGLFSQQPAGLPSWSVTPILNRTSPNILPLCKVFFPSPATADLLYRVLTADLLYRVLTDDLLYRVLTDDLL